MSEASNPNAGGADTTMSSIPQRTTDPPVSDVVAGGSPGISDVAPARTPSIARIADGVRSVSAELPLSAGLGAVATALCEGLRALLADVHVGIDARMPRAANGARERVTMTLGPNRDEAPRIHSSSASSERALVRIPTPVEASAPPPTRLFADAGDEVTVRLPPPFDGSAVVIGDADSAFTRDPARASDVRALAELGAIALTAALRALVAIDGVTPASEESRALRELQARVVQTEKLASIGQIATKVVHELNNPLTAIVSYADFLQKKLKNSPPDGQDFERLGRIGEAAARILKFSRDLTHYARPHEEEQNAPVSLSDVLQLAIAFCEHVTNEAGVAVTLRVDPTTPTISGRRGQLTQVFVNLITNACHAIQDGGRAHGEGEIEVVIEPHDKGARVAIGDNGAGISPEHVVRVFDPFFTTKRAGRGSGLGLSIVRSIVESHHGRVWIRSAIGKGTQFVVDFAC